MATTSRRRTIGVMVAGLIVTVTGLAVVLARALEIPRDRTPVIVGGALFLIGAARRAVGGSREVDRA